MADETFDEFKDENDPKQDILAEGREVYGEVPAADDFEARIGGGGPYLDVEQKRQEEILRAAVEGREPDLSSTFLHGVALTDIPSVAPVEQADFRQAIKDSEPGVPDPDLVADEEKREKIEENPEDTGKTEASHVSPTEEFDNPEVAKFAVENDSESTDETNE